MTDPLSLIAVGAAVGGAAGKFVEKAWDSGEKWLVTCKRTFGTSDAVLDIDVAPANGAWL